MNKCKNCVFSKFELTDKGNIRSSISGTCTYNVKIPKMPSCVTRRMASDCRFGWNTIIQRFSIWANDVVDCKCFVDKTVRSQAYLDAILRENEDRGNYEI